MTYTDDGKREIAMKVVCAWCRKLFPGTSPQIWHKDPMPSSVEEALEFERHPSHGLCERCFPLALAECLGGLAGEDSLRSA